VTYPINSFEERGVAIPFTGATLAHARLRAEMSNNHLKLSFLLPNFLDGGSGTYVVPFKHLPTMVELNLEDQALFEQLAELREVTPLAVHASLMDMRSKGYAGVAKTRAAKREIKNAGDAVTYNQYRLVISALREISPDAEAFEIAHLITQDGQTRAKEGFKHFAAAQQTSPNAIMVKLNKWAEIVSPIGLKNSEMPGHLAIKLKQLQRLSEDLKSYLSQQPPEVQMVGRAILDTAKQASQLVLNEIATIHRCEEKIQHVLSKSDSAFEQLQQRINTIAWVMDGWGHLIEAWNASDDSLKADRRVVVEMIGANLPLIPRSLNVASSTYVATSRRSTGGSVRANVDWRTLTPDTEMLQRLAATVSRHMAPQGRYQRIAA
tara:strand:+ start:81635 stop:82768 length:1134 start_codon:yes stop_codon:yes gene_type:complete